MFQNRSEIEASLHALGDQLEAMDAYIPELVVCGGSALNVLGHVRRTTKDVDLIAFAEPSSGDTTLSKADPFPPPLREAAERVARDFNLPHDWLNSGPTSAVDYGLPEDLMKRVETKRFGPRLTVHFLSRYDQIHFKLYAAVDQGPGKHYDDLLALEPTTADIEAAARWSMTHDGSEGYRWSLTDLLEQMGFKDVAARL